MLNGDEMFLWRTSGRSNGKCAMERELLKKAKLIKYLRKELAIMYENGNKALFDNRSDNSKCQYIRGYQDAVATVMWVLYVGEHKNEN